METIKIGLLGCGTVGAGVVKLLNKNSELYQKRAGKHLEVKKILVKNLSKSRSEEIDTSLFTDDPEDILGDSEIDIIVEVMGGTGLSRELILQALKNQKHVVTANKALVAMHGEELFELAKTNKVRLYYEAAVAGGIPIIQAIKRSLVANKITSLYGIINGTTNYILSAMTNEKKDFKEVLEEAQKLGFAEADPTDDVEAFDAAYKLAILASLCFDYRVNIDEVHRVGITSITSKDIEYARQFGYTIKLLAIAKQSENSFEARVHPTMIPIEHPLAGVNGAFNATLLKGDAVGDIMIYGQGAGEFPTASSVVADILNIISEIEQVPNHLMACQHIETASLNSIDSVVTRYFLRILTHDKPGVMGQIGRIFGLCGLSIHTMIQQKDFEGDDAEIVFITHPVQESNLRQAVTQVSQLETTSEICSIIRVEDFDT